MPNLLKHMDTLGVKRGDCAKTVRVAWRAAVKRAHPDVSGAQSNDLMVRINAAYEVLRTGVPKQATPPPSSTTNATRTEEYPPPQHDNVNIELSKKEQRSLRNTMMHRLYKRGVETHLLMPIMPYLGAKLPYKVHIPLRVQVISTAILYVLNSRKFSKGINYIALPKFVYENGRFFQRNDFDIIEINLDADTRRLYGNPLIIEGADVLEGPINNKRVLAVNT